MLSEDQRRLEREASIAAATRLGQRPDFTALEAAIRAALDAIAKAQAAASSQGKTQAPSQGSSSAGWPYDEAPYVTTPHHRRRRRRAQDNDLGL